MTKTYTMQTHEVQVGLLVNADIAQLVEQVFCKHQVGGSNPSIGTTWGYSSVGRAPRLQRGGRGFDSLWLHHCNKTVKLDFNINNCVSNQIQTFNKIINNKGVYK